MLHVFLQDHFCGAVQGGTDGCELYKNFRAVAVVFYHSFDRFQMPDGTRKPVDDLLRLFGIMSMHVMMVMIVLRIGMIMGVVMRMHRTVTVRMPVFIVLMFQKITPLKKNYTEIEGF